MEQGITRKKMSRKEVHDGAAAIIKRTQDIVKMLMAQGFIAAPPPEPKWHTFFIFSAYSNKIPANTSDRSLWLSVITVLTPLPR